MTNKKTWVKLPQGGEIELNFLKDGIEESRQEKWEYRKWFPRPALIDKSGGGGSRLYTGQKYDDKHFKLKDDGWTRDHCGICFQTLAEFKDNTTDDEGYYNGYFWICKSCFKLFIKPADINETLARLEKINK